MTTGIRIATAVSCAVLLLTTPAVAQRARATEHAISPDAGQPTALEGLREGAAVMIQSIDDEDLMATEGHVADVDRCRNRITVRYDDGTFDVLQLTERAAAATWPEEEQVIAAQAAGAQAAVYFNDRDGRRVVHFFKWIG